MIASMFSLLQSDPALASSKKRVLLVDSSRTTRDLRSETMRRLGAEVDCAANISEARCWWRPDFYSLVLVNVPASKSQTDKFCGDIRRLMPHQQIMFLVGKPDYLAMVPRDDQSVSQNGEDDVAARADQAIAAFASNGSRQCWGILEACRRISRVRSKMDARSRAMRDLPGPKRDLETSRPRNRKSEVENLLAVPDPIEETQ
jgi:CheY-like chemotaxis protein